jgi:hypothetical protein
VRGSLAPRSERSIAPLIGLSSRSGGGYTLGLFLPHTTNRPDETTSKSNMKWDKN